MQYGTAKKNPEQKPNTQLFDYGNQTIVQLAHFMEQP